MGSFSPIVFVCTLIWYIVPVYPQIICKSPTSSDRTICSLCHASNGSLPDQTELCACMVSYWSSKYVWTMFFYHLNGYGVSIVAIHCTLLNLMRWLGISFKFTLYVVNAYLNSIRGHFLVSYYLMTSLVRVEIWNWSKRMLVAVLCLTFNVQFINSEQLVISFCDECSIICFTCTPNCQAGQQTCFDFDKCVGQYLVSALDIIDFSVISLSSSCCFSYHMASIYSVAVWMIRLVVI